jgi:hypothetical protein
MLGNSTSEKFFFFSSIFFLHDIDLQIFYSIKEVLGGHGSYRHASDNLNSTYDVRVFLSGTFFEEGFQVESTSRILGSQHDC